VERLQPLDMLVRTLCECGDFDGAATTVTECQAAGGGIWTTCTLSIGLIISGDIEKGLELLKGVTPSARLVAMQNVGYCLAAREDMNRLDTVLPELTALDKLGLASGQAFFLQDTGRFHDAILPLQTALDLTLQLRKEAPPSEKPTLLSSAPIRFGRDRGPLHDGQLIDDLKADLAINLARVGQHDRADAVALTIDAPVTQRRIARAVCVCQAEAGDYSGARIRCMRLASGSDRARVLASIAAVLENNRFLRSVAICGCLQTHTPVPDHTTTASLLSEAIQVARGVEDTGERQVVLLWIATAAMVCGANETSAAVSLVLLDAEHRAMFLRILDNGGDEVLARRDAQWEESRRRR
jgi:hypothetical protein